MPKSVLGGKFPYMDVLRRWWKRAAGAAVALLAIWSVGDRVLDAYGRAGELAELAKHDSLAFKSLDWLFSTPAWVPGACAVAITAILAAGLVADHAARRGTLRHSTPSAPREVKEWLHPAEAFARFADEALKAARDAAHQKMWAAMEERNDIAAEIKTLTFANTVEMEERAARARELSQKLEDLNVEGVPMSEIWASVADRTINEEIYQRLGRGALLAKGVVAPVTPQSTEIVIPPEWWRFLRVNEETAEAWGPAPDNTHIVGVVIGKPDHT